MSRQVEKVKSRTPAVPTGYTGRKVQTIRDLTAPEYPSSTQGPRDSRRYKGKLFRTQITTIVLIHPLVPASRLPSGTLKRRSAARQLARLTVVRLT